MAKETFENKMLNGVLETDKPRMQFLIDNRALTVGVVEYIYKHTHFVSTRCVDNEKHWQVLYNFSDFLELKRLFEQIKAQKESGVFEGLAEKEAKFEEIKKKFDVSNNEFVLRAKKDAAEWEEFLKYVYLVDGAKQSLEVCEQTNLLGGAIKKWFNTGYSKHELLNLISETHLACLSDNGLKGFNVEVVDGEGVRLSITDKTLYVGSILIEKPNLTSLDLLKLLESVLNQSELAVITTKLFNPLKSLTPLEKAIAYERATSLVNAIREERLISNTPALNNLLTLNSANLILQTQTEMGNAWATELVSKLSSTQLTEITQERIVQEFYKSHLLSFQEGVKKFETNLIKQAKSLK